MKNGTTSTRFNENYVGTATGFARVEYVGQGAAHKEDVFARVERETGVKIPSKLQTEQVRRLLEEVAEKWADVDTTGLKNKRAFENELERALKLRARDMPVTIAYFDLNDFKSVNDLYGHDAGDEAIQYTADILKRNLRGADFVAHWGGDEFVVLMYDGLDPNALNTHMDEVKAAIAEKPFIYTDANGKQIPIELSAKGGVRQIQSDDTKKRIMKYLDDAMESDKSSQRGARARLAKAEASGPRRP